MGVYFFGYGSADDGCEGGDEDLCGDGGGEDG